MKKSAVLAHLDVALTLARYEGDDFVAYLVAMAKTAVEQAGKNAAHKKAA